MSKMSTGRWCLSDLWELSKQGHPAFSVAENGKINFDVVMWENDEPDKYGNHFAVQLKKEKKEDKAVYIGNLKRFSSSGRIAASAQISADKNNSNDDLPF